MAKLNKVLYNIDQTGDTSAAEKKTARKNIGCPEIATSTTSLPPVETNVSKLLITNDGRVNADNTIIGNIAPNPGQNDTGKFLVAKWSGSPGIGNYDLTAINQVPDIVNAENGYVLTVRRDGSQGQKTVTWYKGAKSPAVSCIDISNIEWNGPLTAGQERDVYSMTVAASDWVHWTLCGNLMSANSTTDDNGVIVTVYKDGAKVYEHNVWIPRAGTEQSVVDCHFSVTGAFTNDGTATATYKIVVSNLRGVNQLLQASHMKLTLLTTQGA